MNIVNSFKSHHLLRSEGKAFSLSKKEAPPDMALCVMAAGTSTGVET